VPAQLGACWKRAGCVSKQANATSTALCMAGSPVRIRALCADLLRDRAGWYVPCKLTLSCAPALCLSVLCGFDCRPDGPEPELVRDLPLP